MNLTIVSTGQFPDTHASAIRQSILVKGLSEQGHKITFLVLTPQNWYGNKSINHNNINFEALNLYQGLNKFLKKYHALVSIFNARKILKKQAKQNKIDALVIFTIEILPIFFLIKLAHSLNVKVFHERTELPYALVGSSRKNKLLLNIYLRKLLPLFDGVFVISDKLNTYIQQFNPATQKLLTVVDLPFFTTSKPSVYAFKYIGYCGTISGNKDGVPILIEAFAKITHRFPELKLVLVGNNSNKAAIKETLDAIKQLNLTDKVIFTGLVDRNMMPVILCNAEILVVSKPDNEQNAGNFPIKIGEYLATGKPLVATKVGEIPEFLKDGENAFLAIPGNAESFAQKMEEALSNLENASAIGLKGKKIAEDFFDYKIQASVMSDFISKTNQN